MTQPLEVKISKSVPGGATAVAEFVASDRLNKVSGLKKAALQRAGFSGKERQALVLDDGKRARVLVGLGESAKVGTDQLRTAAATFVRHAAKHRKLGVQYPTGLDLDGQAGVRALTEGLLLAAYRFDGYKSEPEDLSRTATVAIGDADTSVRAAREAARRGGAVADAVCFARDLVNEPGGALTPREFARRGAEAAEAAGLTAVIFDEAAIEAEGLGGLLAVNRGSVEPPRLLKLIYEPHLAVGADADPAASEEPNVDSTAASGDDDAAGPESDALDTVALVGKGITFDSGGLSLKPADSMMEMKCDKAGAAAVVATMCALPRLGVAARVVSFTPLTDNMPSGSAQRPGDIYTARNGTTVEVLNTDAEGRLVLADALTLAGEEEPDAIIDLATLTGACMVALGNRIAGLMGNDDGFCDVVEAAARLAGEKVWQLPLPREYRSQLDSEVADIKNIGSGRYGGALTAGLFLKEFVDDDTPWAHLDIAGPAFSSEGDVDAAKGATGFGVRTLLTLLENWGDAMEALEDIAQIEALEAELDLLED